jgi:sterol desaturase/sphingolipid hydroxylase (fatty acid hydroxylase superfamily)
VVAPAGLGAGIRRGRGRPELFHDQHHSLVGCNYGGFTTIWDRVFGTVSPAYASDFESLEWRAPLST